MYDKMQNVCFIYFVNSLNTKECSKYKVYKGVNYNEENYFGGNSTWPLIWYWN